MPSLKKKLTNLVKKHPHLKHFLRNPINFYNNIKFTSRERKSLNFFLKIKSEDTKKFLTGLYTNYQSELNKIFGELQSIRTQIVNIPKSLLPNVKRLKDNTIKHSAYIGDCIYLYLLIRHYKPEVVFEIGTWIGTTAAIMAEALKKNGYGKLYTCDINDVYKISDNYKDIITFYNTHSDKALDKLYHNNIKVDFVFNDATISKKTVYKFKKVFSKEIIFTTHDYTPPNHKGVRCFYLIKKEFVKNSKNFLFFLPENNNGYDFGLPFKINKTIALLISKNLVKNN